MKKLLALAAATALATAAVGQLIGPRYFDSSGGIHDAQGVFPIDAPGGPSVSRQEVFALATANVAVAQVQVYGGQYLFNPLCTTWGTVTFASLGPDQTTWQTIASYTAAPATPSVQLALGTRANVRVTLSGSAGCNIKLSRVPA